MNKDSQIEAIVRKVLDLYYFNDEDDTFGKAARAFQKELSTLLNTEIEKVTKNEEWVDVGAIPASTDYALGWNDCRQKVYQLNAPQKQDLDKGAK